MKINFTYIIECIVLVLSLVIFMGISYRIDLLESKMSELDYSQTLILRQLEENEKEINDVDKLINKYSKQFGVDKNLAHAVAQVESGKRQEVISKSGCVGIYQVKPSTAKSMGENPYSVEGNIRAGIKYLAYLNKKFNGDTDLVLAGYNSGVGNVKKYNGIPPFVETKHYIKNVKKEKNKLSNK